MGFFPCNMLSLTSKKEHKSLQTIRNAFIDHPVFSQCMIYPTVSSLRLVFIPKMDLRISSDLTAQ